MEGRFWVVMEWCTHTCGGMVWLLLLDTENFRLKIIYAVTHQRSIDPRSSKSVRTLSLCSCESFITTQYQQQQHTFDFLFFLCLCFLSLLQATVKETEGTCVSPQKSHHANFALNKMLRRPRVHLSFFGKTRLGQEALQQAQKEMRTLDKNPNPLIRYLSKKRKVDMMQVELEGRIAQTLHPSFRHAMLGLTALLCAPVLFGLVLGVIQPTYYLFVSMGGMARDRYDKLWTFASPWIVLGGQLCLFAIVYDLSIYIRVPFFFYVLAPLYRRAGYTRAVAKGTKTVHELSKRSTTPRAWRSVKAQAGSVK